MTIGSMLFTKINTDAFSRADQQVSDLQSQIASGKNDPRASVDTIRAARLSVAKEQLAVISRFQTNVAQVEMRLDQTDAALAEVSNVMQRLKEIALRGASDSVNDDERETLRIEVAQLRGNLLDLANAQDDTGGSLFGGYRRIERPFVDGPEGVDYVGDRGRHHLRVSETANLDSGLDGASVFLTVQTDQGARGIFDVVDDLSFTLSGDVSNRREAAEFSNRTELSLNLGRKAQTVSFELAGPGGRAQISADLVQDAPGALIDAINAQSANTGVTASLDTTGRKVVIDAGGPMTMDQMTTTDTARKHLFIAQEYDAAGQQVGPRQLMIPQHLSQSALVGSMDDSLNHVADQRANAGALGQVAQRHADNLSDRQLIMEKSRAGLEDLDVAKAVTELQTLLLTRDVSRQTFVKITQRSLFDFIG